MLCDCFGEGKMLRHGVGITQNWHNTVQDYDYMRVLTKLDWAWECLRRNASFERDYQTISSSDRTLSGRIRQHWGLVFRS